MRKSIYKAIAVLIVATMILCDNSIISLAEEKEDFLLDDCSQLEYSDCESDSEEVADNEIEVDNEECFQEAMNLLGEPDNVVASGSCGDSVTYYVVGNEEIGYACILEGTGSVYDYSSITGAPWRDYDISSLIVEDGITKIGVCNFYGCAQLASVSLPDSLTHISTGAFSNCSSLKTLEIPNSVTYIEGRILDGTELETLSVPFTGVKRDALDYETNIGIWWGFEQSKTRSFKGNTYYRMGEYYYDYYTPASLKTLYINDATIIPDYSFSSDKYLEKVVINEGVKKIGYRAFAGCTNLHSVEIPNSVEKIGDYAFSDCSSFSGSYIFSSNLQSIGDYAFSNCSGITQIEMQYSVNSLGVYAFSGCTELQKVVLSHNIVAINSGTFENCSKLTECELPPFLESIGNEAFRNCDLSEVTFPSQLSIIGGSAFEGCTRIKSIEIPKSVTAVGLAAFKGTSLEWIKIPYVGSRRDYTTYFASFGYIFGYEISSSGSNSGDLKGGYYTEYNGSPYKTRYFNFCTPKSLQYVEVTDATSIPEQAFAHTHIDTIVINEGVSEIGGSAFSSSNISSFEIPDSVKSIGGGAFSNCYNLEELTVPASVTEISGSILTDDRGLRKIVNNSNCEFDLPSVTNDTWLDFDHPENGEITKLGNGTAVRNKGIISFDANGGTEISDTMTVSYGSKYGTMLRATRQGYMMTAWYTGKTDGEIITSDTVKEIPGDQILYAHWTANQGKVIFDSNGGECSESSMNISYGSPYGELPIPVRSGYEFDGWYNAKTGGEQVTKETLFESMTNVTLYAHWSPCTYTVSFDLNGGTETCNSIEVSFKSEYGELPIPKREGYEFIGWFTGKTDGEEITAQSVVDISDDITLFAHWDKKPYDVSLDENGKMTILADGDIERIDGFTPWWENRNAITELDISATGITDASNLFKDMVNLKTIDLSKFDTSNVTDMSNMFAGCKGLTSLDLSNFVIGEDCITDNMLSGLDNLVSITTPNDCRGKVLLPTGKTWYDEFGEVYTEFPKTSVVLHSNGYTDKYIILYEMNGGKNNVLNPFTYKKGKTVTLKNPTKTGYVFDGWFDKSSDEKVSKVEGKDITVYAKWTPYQYFAVFNGNGGTYLPEGAKKASKTYKQEFTFDVPTALQENAFTKNGYTFVGWNTKANGSGASYLPGKVVQRLVKTNKGSITLYAQWKANEYDIVFNVNAQEIYEGDISGKMSVIGTEYGSKVKLPANSFTRKGYTFKGWSKTSDGKVAFKNMASVKNLASEADDQVTLYAVWSINTYSVKYNANGAKKGKAPSAVKNLMYGESKITIAENPFTFNDNYSFIGWNTKKDGTGDFCEIGKTMDLVATKNKQTITLYATWKYSLTYDINGGTGENVVDSECIYNKNVDTSNHGFVKEGYTLAGWNTNQSAANNGKVQYKVNAAAKNLGGKTLYAVWKKSK